MLDFGWPELFLIIGIAVLAIGPDQVPTLLYKLGRFVQRMKYMRFALSQQFESFMNDVEIQNEQASKNTQNKTPDDIASSIHAESDADEDESYILPAGEDQTAPHDQNIPIEPETQDLFDTSGENKS